MPPGWSPDVAQPATARAVKPARISKVRSERLCMVECVFFLFRSSRGREPMAEADYAERKLQRKLCLRLGNASVLPGGVRRGAGFQPAVSRISNPQTLRTFNVTRFVNDQPTGSRRYSRLEICATSGQD